MMLRKKAIVACSIFTIGLVGCGLANTPVEAHKRDMQHVKTVSSSLTTPSMSTDTPGKTDYMKRTLNPSNPEQPNTTSNPHTNSSRQNNSNLQSPEAKHGRVVYPKSRAEICRSYKETHGDAEALKRCGAVINDPNGLEGPKGFPQGGPPDGKIASGGGHYGGVLDQQAADRWEKQDLQTGEHTFTWYYTAAHRTTKWHYYITKQGWNPNEPLKRSSFEKIGEVPWDESPAIPGKPNGSSGYGQPHKIIIPANRSGYHVILAVWDMAATQNNTAFYNVIDVNIKNGENPTPEPGTPAVPKFIDSMATHSAIGLMWHAGEGDETTKKYKLFRNGELITTTEMQGFTDTGLKENTKYTYTLKAINAAGKESAATPPLQVQTLAGEEPEQPEQPDIEAPTAPTNVHSMGTTAHSVDLMWVRSTDNVGVTEYQIFRSGEKDPIHTTTGTSFKDEGLKPDTDYTYTVRAVDAAGNVSEPSRPFTVKTKEEETGARPWLAGSHAQPKTYTAGELVSHNGKLYKVLQTHQNHGQLDWAPDQPGSVNVLFAPQR